MVAVHFGRGTRNVPDDYGGSSHCELLYPWTRFLDFTQEFPRYRWCLLLIIITLGWQMSAMSFRIPECTNSVPTCSGCCKVPATDIHVVAAESMCVARFGGSAPNVPDAYGGSSHCGLLYPWRQFPDFLRNSLDVVSVHFYY